MGYAWEIIKTKKLKFSLMLIAQDLQMKDAQPQPTAHLYGKPSDMEK